MWSICTEFSLQLPSGRSTVLLAEDREIHPLLELATRFSPFSNRNFEIPRNTLRRQKNQRMLRITQLARTDDLALRAGRPRALGTGRTRRLESECDERAYTYQQGSLKGDLGNSSLRCQVHSSLATTSSLNHSWRALTVGLAKALRYRCPDAGIVATGTERQWLTIGSRLDC
jgi:hypothetical protein